VACYSKLRAGRKGHNGPPSARSKSGASQGAGRSGQDQLLQKCRREACEPKAVDKNGKALTGAAKKSFLQKCESEA